MAMIAVLILAIIIHGIHSFSCISSPKAAVPILQALFYRRSVRHDDSTTPIISSILRKYGTKSFMTSSTDVAHDSVTYRQRSGQIQYILQAERYSTRDWVHNLKSLPTSFMLSRIRGVVIFNAVWSSLAYIAYRIVPFSSPGTRPHSLLGSALGLLLVFRTNTSYNRFWEGRRIWDRITSIIRSAGSMIVRTF